MEHKIIKRKNANRKYVRIIQKTYNKQIELLDRIKQLENNNTFDMSFNNGELDDKSILIEKSIESLDMLKFWLDECVPHIDFKVQQLDPNQMEQFRSLT